MSFLFSKGCLNSCFINVYDMYICDNVLAKIVYRFDPVKFQHIRINSQNSNTFGFRLACLLFFLLFCFCFMIAPHRGHCI